MVNTIEMLPGEYSHYVLRYSAIQSGLSDYNMKYPTAKCGRDESLVLTLRIGYNAMFESLMDTLGRLADAKRAKSLDYMINVIERACILGSVNTEPGL